MKKVLLVMAIVVVGVGLGILYKNSSHTQLPKQVIVPKASPSVSLTTQPVTNQFEFTVSDSGKTAIFPITSRFGIIPNGQQYPKSVMQITCTPKDVLGVISNIPSVALPLYAVRYEGVTPGTCTIQNNNFLLKVKIIQ